MLLFYLPSTCNKVPKASLLQNVNFEGPPDSRFDLSLSLERRQAQSQDRGHPGADKSYDTLMGAEQSHSCCSAQSADHEVLMKREIHPQVDPERNCRLTELTPFPKQEMYKDNIHMGRCATLPFCCPGCEAFNSRALYACHLKGVSCQVCGEFTRMNVALACHQCKDGTFGTHFCRDCNHLLCDYCTRQHRNTRAFQPHRLQMIQEVFKPLISPNNLNRDNGTEQNADEFARTVRLLLETEISSPRAGSLPIHKRTSLHRDEWGSGTLVSRSSGASLKYTTLRRQNSDPELWQRSFSQSMPAMMPLAH